MFEIALQILNIHVYENYDKNIIVWLQKKILRIHFSYQQFFVLDVY